MSGIKTYRIILSGRVQGVGYRYFVEEKARLYNIKGYVKNTFDNKVEIVCQGKRESLDIFRKRIKQGPAFAHVAGIIENSIENANSYSNFEIIY
ncbi:MAG: acylphosphatase [Actinobacteria bacterium]|nr:acylphosphatase [Actinomycetota bacterium]